jgi:hypothetical protein
MNNRLLFPSIVLSLGILVGLYLLGQNIYNTRMANRYVTVKGLAEKEVKADKGSWNLQSQFAGTSSERLRDKADQQLKIIREFLREKGFSDDEVSVVEYNIRQNYYNNNSLPYIASIQVSVFTEKVDLLEQIASNVNELIEKGIELSGDRWATRPRYYFTRINDVKPELLASSMQAALNSAEEFANNSGAEVGGIKYASQGIISLIPANRINEGEEFHKMKIARVVSTIDYFIE